GRNRRRWEKLRSTQVRLRYGRFLARAPLRGLEGEVGLPASPPTEEIVFQLYRQGRPLGYRCFRAGEPDAPDLPGGLMVAANHNGLEADPDWSGVAAEQALAGVEQAVREVLPALYGSLPEEHPLGQAYLEAYRAWRTT
ncbi:MAG: hypothetical protein AB1758_30110, partial [Candidatus Eremiobacterota bacterium]